MLMSNMNKTDCYMKYFRIIVPFSFGEANTLTITTFWNGDYSTSPLWMFLKAGSSLPTSKNFDKQLVYVIVN